MDKAKRIVAYLEIEKEDGSVEKRGLGMEPILDRVGSYDPIGTRKVAREFGLIIAMTCCEILGISLDYDPEKELLYGRAP